jgi:hypothetical protein
MMFSGLKMSSLTWSWHSTCRANADKMTPLVISCKADCLACEIVEAQCIGDIEKADNEVKLRVGEVYKPPRAFQPCAIFC